MKLSDRPHIKALIEKFNEERANAARKGIKIRPSVEGPYIQINGGTFRKGTLEYTQATRP